MAHEKLRDLLDDFQYKLTKLDNEPKQKVLNLYDETISLILAYFRELMPKEKEELRIQPDDICIEDWIIMVNKRDAYNFCCRKMLNKLKE